LTSSHFQSIATHVHQLGNKNAPGGNYRESYFFYMSGVQSNHCVGFHIGSARRIDENEIISELAVMALTLYPEKEVQVNEWEESYSS
jgi:hypothetical protein